MTGVFLAAALLAAVSPVTIEPLAFPQREFNVVDYGARSDGSDATLAFKRAISACVKNGGGRVRVPAGTYFTGPVHLKSNVDFHLDEGAILDFSDDPQAYLPAVPSTWEGLECMNYSPLVYAYGCTNVALTGRGMLRPRMTRWKAIMEESKTDIASARAILYKWGSEDFPVSRRVMPEASPAVMRPQLVQFNRSKDVLIADIRIRESPFWTIHLFLSENIVVRNVDVEAHGFNNDGIDIEMTRNVLVDGGVFNAGDDGFVFKSGRNRDAWRIGVPTENVLVRNAHVKFAHSLLCVGSEMSAGVRNVTVENCRVDDCMRLFYVKTNARRGGFVDGITLRGVEAGSVDEMLTVDTDVLYQWRVLPTYEERITGISGLTMESVSVGRVKDAIVLKGDRRNPIDGVCLKDVSVGRVSGEAVRLEAVRHADFSGLKIGESNGTAVTNGVAGGRYVFLGDSITKQAYWIEALTTALLLRYPTTAFRFVNAGIAGDTARDALPRLKEEVLDASPDVLTVMFGMNDVRRECYVPHPTAQQVEERVKALTEYPVLMKEIANRLSASCPGTRVFWMTPTPYDEDVTLAAPITPGVADALRGCSRTVELMAKERGDGVVDLNASMTEANALGRRTDAAFTLCGEDRIHPRAAGGSFMASQILKAWGVERQTTQVTVDLRERPEARSENADVWDLLRTADEVSFGVIEHALPLPESSKERECRDQGHLQDCLGHERMTVVGLPGGRWTLSIDGKTVLTAGAEAFAEGVDLSGRSTPQALQAERVMELNHERIALESDLRTLAGARWYLKGRGVDPDDPAAVDRQVEKVVGEDGYYAKLVRRYAKERSELKARRMRLSDLEKRIDDARRPVLRSWRLQKLD